MEKYYDIYGIWKVCTEGDCEGRSIKDLGVYEGNIDDIAFALADRAIYSLSFSKVNPCELDIDSTPKCKCIAIQLPMETGTWSLTPAARALEVGSWLKGRPVTVSESNMYGCVKLTTNNKTLEEKRAAALSKLTKEERKLLGLE